MVIHLILLFSLLHLGSTSASSSEALPGCRDNCGSITVSYPFGIGEGCHADGFRMICDSSYDPPKLFMYSTNIEVASLSPDVLLIRGSMARECYGEVINSTEYQVSTDLSGTPYTFSHTRNRFTALGCDAVALVSRLGSLDFAIGCMALCRDQRSAVNGSCSGIGCCQTAIPRGLKGFVAVLGTMYNHERTRSFSPCSYAFLVDEQQFKFSVWDFLDYRDRSSVPVVLDWAVGNLTCKETERAGSRLCKANSECLDSSNGPGYRCRCNTGYQGNPYLAEGCQDINECEDQRNNPCVDVCLNTPGSYICSCSSGASGDGRRDGSGCTRTSKTFPLVQVVLGSGLGFLAFLVTCSLLYWGAKRRMLIKLRHKLFKQNGGLLLQQRIASHKGAAESFKIFTAEELSKATNNYSQSRVVGRGGHGTVYKGILPDNRVVAIKRSMVVDKTETEQFINEVVILSQVIHRNLVKILGCCLETQVPLLVYEYVPNGTLSGHLRGPGRYSSLSWESRLRMALETAGALAYLHSATARPIIHRDVKSTNVLLDENYTAKVSDFGASRFVPLGRAHLTTMVQGTFGYLDPEYFQTGQLTDKSDVYSFGVVLVELLTGEKPVSSERSDEERSLAKYFILSMARNQLLDVLEPRVVEEGGRAQLVEVARLAIRCLSMTSEERPTMRELVEELERVKRLPMMHPWAQEENEEETLLG